MHGQRVCLALLALATIAIAKPAGPPAWANYAGKPVYARSLGPPAGTGIGSITVPFKPKSSPFFPKFVDPAMMISKKTDMLSNLFGGLGPVSYPGDLSAGYLGAGKPVLYSDEPSKEPSELEEILGTDKAPASELKRGVLGPVGAKFGPVGSKFGPMGPKFGPMGPKFGPMGPKFYPGLSPFAPFGPFGPFGGKYGSIDGSDDSDSSDIPTNSVDSRRKRSITAGASGTPPPYPGLGPIAEESEPEVSLTPKQFLPGMFGPFGPYGPSPFAAGPAVDPGMFISKKTSFLDSLFKNIATSTVAPVDSPVDTPAQKPEIVPADFWSSFDTATDAPAPKPTIVPPGYWTPSAIVPGPMEYTNKVSDFLDKLFDSLKLNKTTASTKTTFARSLPLDADVTTKKIARSVDDIATISAAKDAIVDSIIEELGSLKTDMFNTMNDLIAAQMPPVPATPFPTKPAKPGKAGKPAKPASPFKAAFASMWTPPPPVDTTLPFKQKMTVLSQVFDMLTGLQKNITLAIQDSISKSSPTEAPVSDEDSQDVAGNADLAAQLNSTLLDAIRGKLAGLETSTPTLTPVNPYFGGKYARAVSDKNAWPYPQTSKRETGDDDYDFDVYENKNQANHEQFKRGVKMSMHQGYQSMPPGTIETVQAGGGSVPGHQGGGIKLLDQQENPYEEYGEKWAAWAQSMKQKNEGRQNHHHHNHH